MPPTFLILSRDNAAAYEPGRKEVCISISDPSDLPVPFSPKFAAVLRLSFSDIGEATRLHRAGDVLFDAEHAKRTIEFIKRWNAVDQIVVHCRAGMSRSPAIALAICDLQHWPVEDLERRFPGWNKWVRREFGRVSRQTST